jgi:SPP1 gp7 family putative phage head morphogenesis protein
MANFIESIGKGLKHFAENLPGFFGGNSSSVQNLNNTPVQIDPNGNVINQDHNIYLPALLTTDGQAPRYAGPPLQGYGVEGTQKFGGFYAEEYLPILQGRNGVQIFDEMFRSDSQVYTATLRTFNKLKGAKYYIKPPDRSEAAKKRAEKLTYCMFKSPVKVWHDNLNDILSFLIYAFSVLEPTFRQENHRKFGNLWCVNSYGWRSQKTIWQWYTYKDKIHAIRQISWGDDFNYANIPGQAFITLERPDGKKEDVPWSEIIVFSHLRFGNNLEGISPLRPMYRPFLIKNNLHKVNAVGIENNARGVRVFSVDPEFLGTDKDKELDKINQKSVMSNVPMIKIAKDKMTFDYFKTDYQAGPITESLRMMDADIAKVTQTEQSEMGMTQAGGNRSLGESKESSHDESIKNYAEYVCQKLNPLIKFLEICNDGEQDDYCELAVEGIDAKPSLEDAQKLKTLVDAGFIDPQDPEMRAYINEHFDLPILGSEIGQGEDGDVESGDTGDKRQQILKGAKQEGGEHAQDLQDALDAAAKGKKVNVDDLLQKIAKAHIKKNPNEYKGSEGARFDGPGSGRYPLESYRELFSEFTPRRVLTEYEHKVNFAEINRDFDNLDAKYTAEIRNSIKKFLMPNYKKALLTALKDSRNKHADLQGVEFGKKTKVREIIKGLMLDAVKLGRVQAINELNYKRVVNTLFAERGDIPAGTYGWVKANAEYATDTLYGDLTKKAEGQALKSLDNGRTDDETAYDVGEVIDEWTDIDTNLGAGVVVNKAYNEGRWSAFEQHSDDIWGYQKSEILDEVTCDLCASLDGKTFSKDDPDAESLYSPLHHCCRGIDIPITKAEAEEEPDWTGLEPDADYLKENDLTIADVMEMQTLSEGKHA